MDAGPLAAALGDCTCATDLLMEAGAAVATAAAALEADSLASPDTRALAAALSGPSAAVRGSIWSYLRFRRSEAAVTLPGATVGAALATGERVAETYNPEDYIVNIRRNKIKKLQKQANIFTELGRSGVALVWAGAAGASLCTASSTAP